MILNYKRLFVLLALLGAFVTPVLADASWTQIDASEPFVDRSGTPRAPSCSGGPVWQPGTNGSELVPAETDYSFFFRPGDPRKLALFFDGGGACWDSNTCVVTALLGSPIYSQTVDETVAELGTTEGLGDPGNPNNPLAGYTLVFIPYCTADLHTGARDTEYAAVGPGNLPINWTIHHRGADNVVAVLEWLDNHYRTEVGMAPSNVFLLGASAGGYGVLYNYPAIAELLPRNTRTRVLVDAANGVINQDFYNRALTPGGVWGAWDNLAPQLANAFASSPDKLIIEIFKSLGAQYPATRFGQYTTAFDATQIGFYNIARNLNSPELWLDPGQLFVSALDWTLRARTYMLATALQSWNYRYYLAQGTDHTVVVDDKFYTETSGGVSFLDWTDDMIHRNWIWGSDWRNVSCAGDCLP
jgi:hypothetical protein